MMRFRAQELKEEHEKQKQLKLDNQQCLCKYLDQQIKDKEMFNKQSYRKGKYKYVFA
jgi:hypothetical protein